MQNIYRRIRCAKIIKLPSFFWGWVWTKKWASARVRWRRQVRACVWAWTKRWSTAMRRRARWHGGWWGGAAEDGREKGFESILGIKIEYKWNPNVILTAEVKENILYFLKRQCRFLNVRGQKYKNWILTKDFSII